MRTPFLTSLAAAAGVAFAAAAGSAQSLNGYTIVLGISSDGRPPFSLTVKAAGTKVRVETDALPGMGGGGGGMAGGLFLLPQDSGKVAVVMPAMGMGLSIDLAMVAGTGRGGRGRARGGAGGGAAGGTVVPDVPDVTDVSASVDDLGAGESILGHPTHKYRIRSSYLVNGERQADTSETWFATDLTGSDDAFAKFYTTFGAAFGGRNSSKSVGDAVRAKMPKGFPVKVVTNSTTPQGPVVTTITASEITKSSFDAADFEVPANIQLMDAGNLMGGRRGGSARS